MDIDRYREFLKRNIPNARDASGNREIVCRCFSCPDSKDPNNGHFYISIPKDDQELSFFNCFKCNYSGIVNYQKLLEWGIFDHDIVIELSNHNKNIMSNPNSRHKLNNEKIYNLNNNYITQDNISEIKLNYINTRLGLNFTYQDIIDNKIILNLNDILSSNNINEFTRHPNIIKQLDSSFIGFISYDNAFINMRNLTNGGKVFKTIDKRYINYSIFNKTDNTCKFYVIPSMVDISSSEPIKLHIAEGAFDILSVKYNLRKETNQSIYVAVSGSGYKGLIRYFISTVKLMNLEIHIYVDSDFDLWKIIDISNYLSAFKYPLYVHRNTIGKDMGVSLDKINETIERMDIGYGK